MEHRVSKLIAKKKHLILALVSMLFIIAALTLSIVGSSALFQYRITKDNFEDNQLVKVIEVSSYNLLGNSYRSLEVPDATEIEDLLSGGGFEFSIVVESQLNVGIPYTTDANLEDTVFLKTFSDDALFEEVNVSGYTFISNKSIPSEDIQMHIPLVDVEAEGLTSSREEELTAHIKHMPEKSALNSYVGDGQVIVSPDVFQKITSMMFQGQEASEVTIRMYVVVGDVRDVKRVASVLSANGFNVSHAFDYYENLDENIERMIYVSVSAMVVQISFILGLLIVVFELMLKSSVGDIATLLHMGFSEKSIRKIYMYPMLKRAAVSVGIVTVVNSLLWWFGIIQDGFDATLFTCVSALAIAVAVLVMFARVRFYASRGVLELLNYYKVEE